MRPLSLIIVLIAICSLDFEAHCEDWPMWRGPRGDGIGQGEDIPTKWSTEENIRWKLEIPGEGRIVCPRRTPFVEDRRSELNAAVIMFWESEAPAELWTQRFGRSLTPPEQ